MMANKDNENYYKMLNTIYDPPLEPNGPKRLWNFFVHSNTTDIVYKCKSAKKIVTEDELFKIIQVQIPDKIIEIAYTPPGCSALYSIKNSIDFEKIQDFTYQ